MICANIAELALLDACGRNARLNRSDLRTLGSDVRHNVASRYAKVGDGEAYLYVGSIRIAGVRRNEREMTGTSACTTYVFLGS